MGRGPNCQTYSSWFVVPSFLLKTCDAVKDLKYFGAKLHILAGSVLMETVTRLVKTLGRVGPVLSPLGPVPLLRAGSAAGAAGRSAHRGPEGEASAGLGGSGGQGVSGCERDASAWPVLSVSGRSVWSWRLGPRGAGMGALGGAPSVRSELVLGCPDLLCGRLWSRVTQRSSRDQRVGVHCKHCRHRCPDPPVEGALPRQVPQVVASVLTAVRVPVSPTHSAIGQTAHVHRFVTWWRVHRGGPGPQV